METCGPVRNASSIPSWLPTRWGTQLNGNLEAEAKLMTDLSQLPTRWGTQLNGNLMKKPV